MTKTTRARILSLIDRDTSYDVGTVRVHRDGRITAKRDADKTRSGTEPGRYLVAMVRDFAGNQSPLSTREG